MRRVGNALLDAWPRFRAIGEQTDKRWRRRRLERARPATGDDSLRWQAEISGELYIKGLKQAANVRQERIVRILRWMLIGLGGLAVVVTVLPFIPSNESAIRIWDFPRIQVAVLLAAVLVAALIYMPLRKRRTWAFGAVLAGALAWQTYSIWPYTPLAETEAKALASCEPDSRVTLLVANVLIENREAGPLLALLERVSPDLVLLVETDSWWDRQLEPLEQAYPHAISHPQEDSHGIHLFSRFELIGPEVRFLVEDYVPSIKTGLRLPSGPRIDLYGLHPRPPPLQDTARRDAELLIVGEEVREEAAPSIVAGDLNDVAWSRTNNLFREVSGLLDPRIERWTHLVRQFGGSAKVDSGFDYAANFSSSLSIA